MREIAIVILIFWFGTIMFVIGYEYQDKDKKLNKTIVLNLQDKELPPSEGDLLRVRYIDGSKVYLCVID